MNGPGSTTNRPPQMTDEWIDYVVEKIRDEATAAVPPLQNKLDLADAIELARSQPGKLTKVVTAVDRTGGQLEGGITIIKIN